MAETIKSTCKGCEKSGTRECAELFGERLIEVMTNPGTIVEGRIGVCAGTDKGIMVVGKGGKVIKSGVPERMITDEIINGGRILILPEKERL